MRLGVVIIGNPFDMSFKKGGKFEHYTASLFPPSHYELLHRTPEFREEFSEECLLPDFKFKDKKTGFEFYVEAKYRKAIYGDKLEWCDREQLYRYKEYDKEAPVFIMIGLEGNPADPEYVFLIPLQAAPFTGFFESVLDQHLRETDGRVKSKELWKNG
jgi:hypothetical protein